jgi:hypothetical protein
MINTGGDTLIIIRYLFGYLRAVHDGGNGCVVEGGKFRSAFGSE